MEKHTFVDQQRLSAVKQFVAVHGKRLARQGTIVATYRQRGGRRLGPYYRLTCRDGDQRQVSVYLGPEGPVVALARRLLAELQERQRQQKSWTRLRRSVRQQLKVARHRLKEELAQYGLRTQGAEIRGWRELGSTHGMLRDDRLVS